jgi:hypothetical protein
MVKLKLKEEKWIMALSNIRREPRREITESLIGIVVGGLFLGIDYCFSVWFYGVTGGDAYKGAPIVPIAIGMLILPLGLSFLVLVWMVFAYGTHALGEIVCEKLAAHNLDPRPKDRSGRR